MFQGFFKWLENLWQQSLWNSWAEEGNSPKKKKNEYGLGPEIGGTALLLKYCRLPIVNEYRKGKLKNYP